MPGRGAGAARSMGDISFATMSARGGNHRAAQSADRQESGRDMGRRGTLDPGPWRRAFPISRCEVALVAQESPALWEPVASEYWARAPPDEQVPAWRAACGCAGGGSGIRTGGGASQEAEQARAPQACAAFPPDLAARAGGDPTGFGRERFAQAAAVAARVEPVSRLRAAPLEA